jgi:hypothetical protein
MDWLLDLAAVGERGKEWVQLVIELPQPIQSSKDMHRVLRAKIEAIGTQSYAPILEVMLTAAELSQHYGQPLSLLEPVANGSGARAQLVAELCAEYGNDAVGVLLEQDTWDFRDRSVLVPLNGRKDSRQSDRTGASYIRHEAPMPAKLLDAPIALDAGDVKVLRFLLRLEGNAWWSGENVQSDYVAASLGHGYTGSRFSAARIACVRLDRRQEKGGHDVAHVVGWFD